MQWIYNKHGTDFDVGFPMTRMPRDGTERKPRDGTEGMPRDGTERKPRDGTEGMPRDGTERKPRDKTLLRKGNLLNWLTEPKQDVRTNSRPSSRLRTTERSKPAYWTGKARDMSLSERFDN